MKSKEKRDLWLIIYPKLIFGGQILVTLLILCHDFGCLNINKVIMLFTVGPHGDDKDSGK